MSKLLEKINKIGGDSELYQGVFNKCATAQKLTGNEYAWGQHLAEYGLMEVSRVPKWVDGQFKGHDVYFTSYTPVL